MIPRALHPGDQPRSQRLADPGARRAAAPVVLVERVHPVAGLEVLVRAVAAAAGRAVVTGVQRGRARPPRAEHRLHVLAVLAGRALHSPYLEHRSGEDDGELPTAAVASVRRPAGMAGLDEPVEIDPVLRQVDQQRLLLLCRVAEGEQKPRSADRSRDLTRVVGHVLDRAVEVEEEVVDPRPAEVLLPLPERRKRGDGGELRQEVAPQVPGVEDWRALSDIGGPEGIRRERRGDAREDRDALDGAVR